MLVLLEDFGIGVFSSLKSWNTKIPVGEVMSGIRQNSIQLVEMTLSIFSSSVITFILILSLSIYVITINPVVFMFYFDRFINIDNEKRYE